MYICLQTGSKRLQALLDWYFSGGPGRNDGYIGEIRLNLLQSSKFALEEAMEVT